jgi:hypothetical protein
VKARRSEVSFMAPRRINLRRPMLNVQVSMAGFG